MAEEIKKEVAKTTPKPKIEKVKTIEEKLQEARVLLKDEKITASGYNDFTKSSYYLLSDILPPVTKVCHKVGICPLFSYENDITILTIHNTTGSDKLIVTSPTIELEVKISKAGKEISNKMQALAGNQTSQRRMLLVSTFDIVNEDEDGADNEISIDRHSLFEIKKRIEMKVTELMKEGYDINQIVKKAGLKDDKHYAQILNGFATINTIEKNLNVLIYDKSKLDDSKS